MPTVPIGHEAAREFLRRSITEDKVSHAYCFTGPTHVGKGELAEWFMGELVGRGVEATEEDFSAFRTNPDVIVIRREVEDEKMKAHVTINQIRELRIKLGMSSFLNSWKVAVILEAETMTTEAANALLKTLEEPAPKTVILLLTTAWEQIPQTIRSRCQTVYLRPVPSATLERAFSSRGVGREQVRTAVRISGGRPGAARRLIADKKALEDELVQYEVCASMLAAPRETRLQHAEALAKEKESLGIFFHRARVILHDLLLPEHEFGAYGYLPADFEPLRSLRAKIAPARATVTLGTLEETDRAIAENVNPRLALEHLFLAF